MGITFRVELYLECDAARDGFQADCTQNLSLDQLDLPSVVRPTARRLGREAIKMGWVIQAENKCYCPSCAKRLGLVH